MRQEACESTRGRADVKKQRGGGRGADVRRGEDEEKKQTVYRLVDGPRSRRRSPEVPAGGRRQTSNK